MTGAQTPCRRPTFLAMTRQQQHARAVAHLASADPRLAAVIRRVGPCTLAPRAEGTHFEAVARAIVYQQLSGKAAHTIHTRLVALAGGALSPEGILALPDSALRDAGLSRQKAAYLRDLAARAAAATLPIEILHELADDAVIESLTGVHGVGRWTAQMFLIFRLGRLDVFPELDLGVRKGIQQAYRLRALPTPRRAQEIGERWAPYRSLGSWYMWRLLDAEAYRRQGG